MSVRVMNCVWQHSKQKANRLLMLLAIADNADDDGWAYPSIPTLQRKVRVNRRNTFKILDALEAAGDVVIFNRLNEDVADQHHSNVYHLARYGRADALPPQDLRGSIINRLLLKTEVSPETPPGSVASDTGGDVTSDTTLVSPETPPGSVAKDTGVVSPETPESSSNPSPSESSVESSSSTADDDADVRPLVVALFEKAYGRLVSNGFEKEELLDMQAEFPEDWLKDAFRAAGKRHARTLQYVRTTLEAWRRDGKPVTDFKGKRSTSNSASEANNVPPRRAVKPPPLPSYLRNPSTDKTIEEQTS